MAAAFWTLEDGRCYATRCSHMAYMLRLITDELGLIKGAGEFFEYLEPLVIREENGDFYNGFGGFIRGDQNIMFNFDLRTIAPKNREFFWRATQLALTKFITEPDTDNETVVYNFSRLLDMHKRIKKGEDPFLLNDIKILRPETFEKLGPGWQ